jgi:hypothetical protein
MRGLKREELYIETQNDTRKGVTNNNVKLIREKSVRERRAIHSDTELYTERSKQEQCESV